VTAATEESARISSNSPRIALFGPYSSRNLGDTATQMAVISNLGHRIPRARFVGVSPEPADTFESLGIPAFPLSGIGDMVGERGADATHSPLDPASQLARLRAAKRVSSFIQSLDLLVISGGGQIDDFWGGPWAHPWSMLFWTLLARRHGVPVAWLAVGVDTLQSRLSRRFCVWGLNRATWRSFRDPVSRQTMLDLGLSRPSTVCPDLVFGLALDAARQSGEQPFVVLSPISRKTWSHQESTAQRKYMDALVRCGLLFSQQGLAIKIVCSQSVMDIDDARQLEQSLVEGGALQVALCEAREVADFLHHVAGAELVIASRLHAVILSLTTGAPVVAVAHLAKVEAAMNAVGLGDFCLSLQRVEADQLCTLSWRAYQERTVLARKVERADRRLRGELDVTFDALALLIHR